MAKSHNNWPIDVLIANPTPEIVVIHSLEMDRLRNRDAEVKLNHKAGKTLPVEALTKYAVTQTTESFYCAMR